MKATLTPVPAPSSPSPLVVPIVPDASALEVALALASVGIGVFPLRPMFKTGDPARPLACDCEKTPRRAARRRKEPGADVVPLRPCGRAGKHPATKHSHLDASTDPAVIRKWFGARPCPGIGVRCGPIAGTGLDLVVLDFDGAEGANTLARLETARGPIYGLGVTTGGGAHRWYVVPSDWRGHCRNGHHPCALGDKPPPPYKSGFDVKAEGGFVVAPPSMHKRARPYRWMRLEGASFEDDRVIIPLAPEWLRAELPTRAEAPASASDDATLDMFSAGAERRGRYAIAAIAAIVRDLENASSYRNDALMRAAIRCFRLAQAADLNAHEIKAHLRCAALLTGLQPGEVESTLASSERYAAQAGAATIPPGDYAPRQRDDADPNGGGRRRVSSEPPSPSPATPSPAPRGELDQWHRPRRWPASAAPLPRLLRTTSDTALGELLIEAHGLDGTGERIHGGDGLLWRWTGRVWSALDPADLALWVSGLDGATILTGARPKEFGVSNPKVKTVIAQAVTLAQGKDRLPEGGGGVALADAHLSIGEGGRLEYRPAAPSHGARFALDFTAAAVKAAAAAPPGPWAAFLAEILDPPVALALGELVGLALFGLGARFQRAGLMLGAGANGKSTALDTIAALFPEGVGSVPPSKWSDGPSALMLRGRRLNLVAELPATRGGAATVFKEVVSGDLITRRDVYQPAVSFRPAALHLFSANDPPETEDQSGGYWRRWLVLPFDKVVPVERRRPGLAAELIAEALPEVAAWALAGAVRAIARGALAEPSASAEAMTEWRDSSDSVALWWSDELGDFAPGQFMATTTLYARYAAWAEKAGYRHPPDLSKWRRTFVKLPGVASGKRTSKARGFNVNVPE